MAVPEPQSLALFGLALVALPLARRRQFGRKYPIARRTLRAEIDGHYAQ